MDRAICKRLLIVFSIVCVTESSFVSASRAVVIAQPVPAYTADGPAAATTDYQCERRATIEDTVADCGEVKKKHGGWVWKAALGLAIAVVVGLILKRTVFASGNQPVTQQMLLDNGPQLPLSYPVGSLTVRGFAQDGWPVVVDFEPQPGTVTALDVSVGKRRQTLVLDPDGSHGRQLVKVFLGDRSGAPVPLPATYFVRSMPIASLDSDRPQVPSLAPLQIYGIGGGPSAVGSVAIEQVTFARAQPGAQFSYSAKSAFSRARAQVQQLRMTPRDISIRPVFDVSRSNLGIGSQSGAWDGKSAGQPSTGLHRLQVTGWFTTDDRSWVAALAPGLVTQ